MSSVLVIAGEQSGEEIALGFLPQIKEALPQVQFFGVGGERCKEFGMELVYHLHEFSSWGISEVVSKIPFYLNALSKIENECKKRKVEYALLVDFQTFNFKLANRLKKQGVKVFYIVAPQAWAWKSWRAAKMAEFVHTLFCLIPFEKKWFQDRGVKNVSVMAHPMYEKFKPVISKKIHKSFQDLGKQVNLLILPGSRKAEVRSLLPVFLETINSLSREFNFNITVLKSSSLPESAYGTNVNLNGSITFTENADAAFNQADLCLACSGTVTLTCALFELPTIVCYRSSLLNQFVFETFVNYTGPISLANIVKADSVATDTERIYPEFIQDQVSVYNIKKYLRNLLTDQEQYEKIKEALSGYASKLAGDEDGVADLFTREYARK